ncbi:hypothetical protein RIF29_29782 [Crotalaria pallida]|uniref:Uncharacterized protein n=1 Tax=Crotalaria pallida TaxID=3830 RepID=A0AAN9EHA5_CROPI
MGILKARDALKNGFLIRLGQGNVSLWYDKWMTNSYLCEQVDYVHISDTTLKVKDVWVNGVWDLCMLYTIIPEAVKCIIYSIPVPVMQSCSDQTVWADHSNGVYYVAYAYYWLGRVYKGWSASMESAHRVWKIEIPSKLQWFLGLWLIMLFILISCERTVVCALPRLASVAVGVMKL